MGIFHHQKDIVPFEGDSMQLNDVGVRQVIVQSGLANDGLVDMAHQTLVVVDGLLDGHTVSIVFGTIHLAEATLAHQTLERQVFEANHWQLGLLVEIFSMWPMRGVVMPRTQPRLIAFIVLTVVDRWLVDGPTFMMLMVQ